MDALDSIDKRIFLTLDENCRLSYQFIVEMLGVTAIAVNRVDVLLSYPVKDLPRLGRNEIEEMIQEAGIC